MSWKNGLVGYWSLNDGVGPCRDQVNQLDLAKHGRPAHALVIDRPGLCCRGDTQDGALHPDNPVFRLTAATPLTVALGVQFEAAPDGFPFLLAKHSSTQWLKEWALIAAGGTSQRFAFQVFDGDTAIGEAITPGSTLVPGKWHLLIASYDPVAAEVSLSLDGGTPVTGTVTGTPFAGLAPLSLGCDGSLNYFTTACFNSLKLWRRLLTSAEVAELWNDGIYLAE